MQVLAFCRRVISVIPLFSVSGHGWLMLNNSRKIRAGFRFVGIWNNLSIQKSHRQSCMLLSLSCDGVNKAWHVVVVVMLWRGKSMTCCCRCHAVAGTKHDKLLSLSCCGGNKHDMLLSLSCFGGNKAWQVVVALWRDGTKHQMLSLSCCGGNKAWHVVVVVMLWPEQSMTCCCRCHAVAWTKHDMLLSLSCCGLNKAWHVVVVVMLWREQSMTCCCRCHAVAGTKHDS